MIFHDFADWLLANPIKMALLRHLVSQQEGVSGRGFAALVGASHFTVLHVLRELVAQGIVVRSSAGRTHLYRLNRNHILLEKVLLPLFSLERDLYRTLGEDIMTSLDPQPLSVILYGSVARRAETTDSDVDILLLYSGGAGRFSLDESTTDQPVSRS